MDELFVELTVSNRINRDQITTLQTVLRLGTRVVIVGDPGAGKTTVLQYLTLLFSRARISKFNRTPLRADPEELQKLLAARERLKRDYKFARPPFPVPVFLSRLKSVTIWPESKSILDAVEEELAANDILRDIPAGFFRERLRQGDCIFLLDAFDELGAQQARDAIAARIGELGSASSGNTFIVTSRVVGYHGQLSRYGFNTLTLQPLSPELISQLVRKWYSVLREERLAQELLDTLHLNHRIAEIAVNPMLLSLIVLVQYVRRVIPERRYILYEECLRILVERRYAPPTVQAEYNATLPGDEAIYLLKEIAYYMHTHHLREIPRHQLELSLLPATLEHIPLSRASAVPAPEIVRNIEDRSQLLIERGIGDDGEPLMAFSHLTFQEYLVATRLRDLAMSQSESAASTKMIRHYHADPEWWEEVALLYAAHLETTQQEIFFARINSEISNELA